MINVKKLLGKKLIFLTFFGGFSLGINGYSLSEPPACLIGVPPPTDTRFDIIEVIVRTDPADPQKVN